MQISYGPDDIAMFSRNTGAKIPGLSGVQLAQWASSGAVGEAYSTWWQKERAAFHQRIVSFLQGYRSDLKLYYYNWDPDKFSLMEPDINAASFYAEFATPAAATTANATTPGAATAAPVLTPAAATAAYATDRAKRSLYTASRYIDVISSGNFLGSGSGWSNRPDYALRPSLYSNIPGIELFAPANSLAYAGQPDYLNYFQTADGLAVSNVISYDEVAPREPNPKYEGSMVISGGAPFSMAVELLSYFYGDARTLTYTAYTFGRGFADAHRRFAQAFLALPAVRGNVILGTDSNTKVRTYNTTNGTYIGIASKAYTNNSALSIQIPGAWNSKMIVTNLVTNTVIPTVIVGNSLQINLVSGPMELNAYLVK